MKKFYLSKLASMILLITLVVSLCSCGTPSSSSQITPKPSPSPVVNTKPTNTPSPTEAAISPTTKPTQSPVVDSFKMSKYTKAPNKKSTIKIQYPVLSGNNMDAINKLVNDKVESFAKLDPSDSSDTVKEIDYQSAVTLLNDKIVSIVFWGYSNIQGSAHPNDDIYTLNIDRLTQKEVALKDIYTINDDFEKLFFKKAFFPSNPITSGEKATFAERLKYQTPEYIEGGPFGEDNNVNFYLKKDGIVFTMNTSHAAGDHFDAEVKYSDMSPFNLLKQNYWDNK